MITCGTASCCWFCASVVAATAMLCSTTYPSARRHTSCWGWCCSPCTSACTSWKPAWQLSVWVGYPRCATPRWATWSSGECLARMAGCHTTKHRRRPQTWMLPLFLLLPHLGCTAAMHWQDNERPSLPFGGWVGSTETQCCHVHRQALSVTWVDLHYSTRMGRSTL